MISNPAQIRHNSGEFPHLFRSQSSYAPTIPNPICSLCFCETLDVGGEEDLLLFNGRRGYKFTRELLATSEMEAVRTARSATHSGEGLLMNLRPHLRFWRVGETRFRVGMEYSKDCAVFD
ncbi:hypothetical protein Bca4012_052768 [Brassica carinata]